MIQCALNLRRFNVSLREILSALNLRRFNVNLRRFNVNLRRFNFTLDLWRLNLRRFNVHWISEDSIHRSIRSVSYFHNDRFSFHTDLFDLCLSFHTNRFDPCSLSDQSFDLLIHLHRFFRYFTHVRDKTILPLLLMILVIKSIFWFIIKTQIE